MENNIIAYNSFEIEKRDKGFVTLPNSFGKVISFWVINKEKNIRSIFAFAYSALDAFAFTLPSEESLVVEAINKIKEYIDTNKINDLEEYTFEYKGREFSLNQSAEWWKKDLKRLLEDSVK